MAAAYAAAGQYDLAVKTAQEAMKLATAAQAEELAGQMSRRLQLYRQSKPYREPVAGEAAGGP